MMTQLGKVPKSAIGRWYQGVLLPVEPAPRSGPRMLYYKRHWTAKIARIVVTFYLKNWQFVIGTAIGVLGLLLAVLALK